MKRMQVPEIEDYAFCPRSVRDGGTDWLGFMANRTRVFNAIAPKLDAAMQRVGVRRVVDLCSGGGGPWATLGAKLAKNGPLEVTFTDLFPNVRAFESHRELRGDRYRFHPTSVNATDVPAELDGVRTLFNGFHHFPPELARAILADAVRKRKPIAIFEGFDRRLLPLLTMPVQGPLVLLFTPFVRPFKLSRLFFTYAIPLIPFVVVFDGTMSMLRLYLADELRELVASVDGHESFDWDIGTTPIRGMPVGITHLVGMPKPRVTH